MRRRSGFHGAEDVMSGIIKLKGDDLKTLSNKIMIELYPNIELCLVYFISHFFIFMSR